MASKRFDSKRIRGFSLIEGLVGITVLALATAASFVGWSVMLRRNTASHAVAEAAQLARGELERAKLYGVGGLPLGVYDAGTGTALWGGAYDATANAGLGGWISNATVYFDATGKQVASASAATLALTDAVTDTSVLATTGGGYALQATSQREFVATVTLVSSGAVVFRMGTTLVQGGL